MRIDCQNDAFLTEVSTAPGVYKFFNEASILLYVGKAKNLRKRVASYFHKQQLDQKTRTLVAQIRFIETLMVDSEMDALLLENNLIKENQPRYNILLKDDKTYPWICLTKEPFPRLFSTRTRRAKDEYFGPFPKGKIHKNLLELIHELYPIRTCRLELTQETITSNKFKVCLEYHLKRCQGPCVAYSQLEVYNSYIDEIRYLLKGKTNALIQKLKRAMENAAEQLQFEAAHHIKQKIETLSAFHSKSVVVNDMALHCDVLSCTLKNQSLYYNYTWVREGRIDFSVTDKLEIPHEEPLEHLLLILWHELTLRFGSQETTILTNIPVTDKLSGFQFITPMRGEKAKLLEFSMKNTMLHQEQQKAVHSKFIDFAARMEALQKILDIAGPLLHIECFDNSNIQGTSAVAACVVFKNGAPEPNSYRHFNIKTVVGPDDFASMREIVYRRYRRLLKEAQHLPNLIVIDGGKGQLSAALDALKELDLIGKVPIIGLAKKLEEIYLPGKESPIVADFSNPGLLLLQHLRDEAHRFGITHHRKKRSASFLVSEFDQIQGVGAKSLEKIRAHYATLKNFESDTLAQQNEKLGLRLALLLRNYLLNS